MDSKDLIVWTKSVEHQNTRFASYESAKPLMKENKLFTVISSLPENDPESNWK